MLDVIDLAKCIIEKAVKPGDRVIDATVGNGNDTVFLARLVEDTGIVYGFEIQKEALLRVRERLDSLSGKKQIMLIHDGHENMDKYVQEPVSAVMFNLGYLPGGDHGIKTRPETTIKALKSSLHHLLPGGVITVACYTGHPGGQEERDAVGQCLKRLKASEYKCIKVDAFNQSNNPPVLYVIEKTKKSNNPTRTYTILF